MKKRWQNIGLLLFCVLMSTIMWVTVKSEKLIPKLYTLRIYQSDFMDVEIRSVTSNRWREYLIAKSSEKRLLVELGRSPELENRKMKRLWVLLILLLLLLAACTGASSNAAEVEAAIVSDDVSSENPTEPEPTTEAPMVTVGSSNKSSSEMECTFVGDSPNVPPEYEAIFGVTESDWGKGSETAAVTIVEYSDFQ